VMQAVFNNLPATLDVSLVALVQQVDSA
jgi:hypothetical protein